MYHSQHYLEICAPVLGVHQVHTKWMNGSCFVHPNLVVLTYPCCETEQALVHLKSLPLLPFDTRVLNYNPGIYYLVLQKTDKAFLLLNTVHLPFCPHIKRPIIVFKKWQSLSLSFIMFLCIRGSPFLLCPATAPTGTVNKMKLLALVCIVLLYIIIWSVHLKIESGLSSLLVTLINAL